MRASILFAGAIALLFFLGVVVAARYSGFFETGAPKTETKKRVPKVLVARANLIAGRTVTVNLVTVRDAYPHELQDYQKNMRQYLPPLTAAAAGRVLIRDIPANEPLKRDYFEELGTMKSLTERLRDLGPGWTTVHLTLPRERAASGLLGPGTRVDVHLTTQICVGNDCTQPLLETALIARDLPIIAKRNTLHSLMISIGSDEEVGYTLAANPYRRALIEFAKNVGTISITPTTTSASHLVKGSFSDTSNPEYRDEDERIAKLMSGQLSVGYRDLERIFNLQPLPKPRPPAPPGSITGPRRTQHVSGVVVLGTSEWNGYSDHTLVNRSGKKMTVPDGGPGRTTKLPSTGRLSSPMPEGSGSINVGRPDSRQYLGYRFQPPPGAISTSARAGTAGG